MYADACSVLGKLDSVHSHTFPLHFLDMPMNNITRCFSGLIMAFALVGVLVVPVTAQGDSSDQQAVEYLKSASKKSLDSSSYTMTMDQEIKQKQPMSNMTVNQTTTGSVKFQNPYIYMNLNSDVKGMAGKAKNASNAQELLGKQDENRELIALFQKSEGPGGWKRMDQNKSINFKKMFNRFRNPDQLSKQLKDVQFDGEETVNGTVCRKINASQKASAIEDAAKEMMKSGGANKMMQKMDLSVDVKNSDMNIWVRKDSMLLEKISVDTEQTVNMSMNIRGNKQSFSMEQDLKMDSTFKDYGTTSVPQKYKDQLEKLLK